LGPKNGLNLPYLEGKKKKKLSYLENKFQHVDKNLGARILIFSNILSDLHPNLAKFILWMPTHLVAHTIGKTKKKP
jgi:hypothetical protein